MLSPLVASYVFGARIFHAMGLLDWLRLWGCSSALALTSVGQWIEASRRSALSLALRATAPVDDLGLVDLVAQVVGRRETGAEADRAVDVVYTAADATNYEGLDREPFFMPGT
jgi:hypothetical protein